MEKSLIIIASPSGGGKSTVAKHLLKVFTLEFSISATTRTKRPGEEHGREYYFISNDEFKYKIENEEFVEYEEIFGNQYGTLKSEIDKALLNNRKLIFDIDVYGALSLKMFYPEHTLLIFLSPPNIDLLEERLRNRNTESEEQIQARISRAKMEMEKAPNFDYVIVNDVLEETLKKVESIIRKNIS